MMKLKAIFLNCTLKKSPETSNTDALIQKVIELMEPMDVECEKLRVVDYQVDFGISSEAISDGDQWPQILKRILASDILVVAMPIWFGVRSSLAQLVFERLDATYSDADPDTGRFPLYNKVGGCIVTGNEDGAHDCSSTSLFNLSHLGCTIPPNADCYWVGDAGPGPSYIEAGGEKHLYTNTTARYMAHNLVTMARLLKQHPIETNLKQLQENAKAVSR